MSPQPLAEAIAQAVPRGQPWSGWLLVALLRHLPRQRWVAQLVPTLREEEGEVPGHPGWRYEFHGIGCCFTADGETVDVDFHGDHGLSIDPFFFARRVLRLRPAGTPELRVREALPNDGLVATALADLRAAKLLWHPKSQHVFRLRQDLEARADEAVDADFSHPDWGFLADDRAAWLAWLARWIDDARAAPHALPVLAAQLPDPDFVALCERVLAGPASPAAARAIELLEEKAIACPAVAGLAFRMDPVRDHPYAMHRAARYLLARGLERDRVIQAVLAFAAVEKVTGFHGNPFAADFAILALEHFPEHAPRLFAQALRTGVPIAREQALDVLLARGEPWCWQALADAFAETGDPSLGAALERRPGR